MNLDHKLNHSLLSDITTAHDNSPSMTTTSYCLPNFQSIHASQFTNPLDSSVGSELSFRQSRNPSPPKQITSQSYSDIKQRNSSASGKKTQSFSREMSPNRASRDSGSFNCSPMKKKLTGDVQAKPPAYLPLADRLSLAREELSEKNKELQEVREVNVKLASEVKSYREKENKLVGEVENKFQKDMNKLSSRDIAQKYQELLAGYKQLLIHSTQVEESLRLETLRGEEQRAYIQSLKQQIATESGSLQSSTVFLRKNLQNSTSASSQKSPGRTVARPEELEQRVSELLESEAALNSEVENLKVELKGVSDGKEVLKTQVEEYKAGVSQKQEEYEKIVDENARLVKENEILKEKMGGEKEKESLLETLREREVMINEMGQENSRLSKEVIKYGKALSEINEKVGNKMKDYESMKGNVEKLKKELEKERKMVVSLECDVKERDVRIKEIMMGKGRNEKEERSEEEIVKENKVLQRKVNILAERVGELKDMEGRNDQALEDMKMIEKEIEKVSLGLLSLEENKKIEDSVKKSGKKEEKWKKIVEVIKLLGEKASGKSEDNKLEGCKEERVSVKEMLRWKEEADRLGGKVKVLIKEKEIINETQEGLYEMLSKAELEMDILRKKLEEKNKSISEMQEQGQGKDEEIVDFLNDEVKLKEEEVEKLKGFIFNEEVKELVEEGMQATREMFRLERNLNQKNRVIGRREDGVKKTKENLEGIRGKRKILEEELFTLWSCEKKKHENMSKLEQQNFQLQNEVSRLMNELEINFSKYEGNSRSYYSYKHDEKPVQFQDRRDSNTETLRKMGSITPERSREAIQKSNLIPVPRAEGSYNNRNIASNMPIAADSYKTRKSRGGSEERVRE